MQAIVKGSSLMIQSYRWTPAYSLHFLSHQAAMAYARGAGLELVRG